MATLLPLLLLALPVLDIISLVQAGGLLGFWPTLALVVGAGLAGAFLVRQQGLAIGASVRASLAEGRLPVIEAFDAACVLIAGALLLLPGLVSDVVAFALLLPPVRAGLRALIAWRLTRRGSTVVWTHATRRDGWRPPPAGGPVIEGEFEEVRRDEPPAPGGSAVLPPRRPSPIVGSDDP
jgi:UPF0716 protein FxsA